ncbi:hypothetical protein FB451DRAFT_627109 [Mycena latifolia]|nr:hypothetical protein FB451DRAFT_627109 [Mycena latifolia]
MVTDADEAGMCTAAVSCTADRFSFTSCPHSSHGFVCTTTPQHPHEHDSQNESQNENQNEDQRPKNHIENDDTDGSVYPSPPPTADEPKRSVPLPHQQQQQHHHFGGILDSPVVLLRGGTSMPLSPPPTIPTPTHALPPAELYPGLSLEPISEQEQDFLPEREHESQQEPALLSPISPEWTTCRRPEGGLCTLEEDDEEEDACVLMRYPFRASADVHVDRGADAQDEDDDHEDDVLRGACAFGRPALPPLDIPGHQAHAPADLDLGPADLGVLLGFQSTHTPMSDEAEPALLGFAGTPMTDEGADAPLYHHEQGALLGFQDEAMRGDGFPADADVPMYHPHENDDVFLGFPCVQPMDMDEAKTPLGFAPPQPRGFTPLGFAPHAHGASPFSSPFSSPRELDDLELDLYSDPGTDSDMSDYGDGGAYGAPSPLRSFASLPSPDLDDLELDMELAPAPSPSRRSATPLPALLPSEELFPSTFPSATAEHMAEDPLPAPPPDPANALLLDLPPAPPAAAFPPSPLDALGPAALAARLPPGVPPAELEALLALRARAAAALAHALATASTSAAGGVGRGTLEYELRRSVPRDVGEPRRRRKRAKEVGREVEALVGLVLGVLPQPSSSSSAASTSTSAASTSSLQASAPGADDLAKQKKPRGEKAGLAGLASVPALVARMILRRRERCVRGLGEGRARASGGSPLRSTLTLDAEGGEGGEPPPMEVAPVPSMEPPPMELVL